MRHRRHGWIAPATALLLLLLAPAARAEGPGIRLGKQLVFHPGIGVDIGYDSNLFFAQGNTVGAAFLRLRPQLDLATRPAQRGGNQPHYVDFRLNFGLNYTEWLTPDPNIARYRFVAINAGMLLTILPHYPFTIDIYDNYSRSVQLPYLQLPVNIVRNTNEAGIRLRYRPGGGRLELQGSYGFGIDFFEDPQFQDLNVFIHRAQLRLSWKFFPKTAIYVEASETAFIYQRVGTFAHPNGFPVRVTAGLIGLLTAKLQLHAWIGYGNGLYQPNPLTGVQGPSPNTAIGGFQLDWRPTILSTGSIGFIHDFQNSLLGSYYDFDRAFISWLQHIWRFSLTARLQYDNIRYQGIQPQSGLMPNPDMSLTRSDNRLALLFSAQYNFKDWLSLSAAYQLLYNQTDAQLNLGPQGLIPLNYLKHEVWLRFAIDY
jgi:hypothetical protein